MKETGVFVDLARTELNELDTQTLEELNQKEVNLTVGADVQAALTVLGRRDSSKDSRQLNLRGANLRGADLSGANLQGVYFFGASLRDAVLFVANLKDAVLKQVNLQGAYLSGPTSVVRTSLGSTSRARSRIAWPKA